MEFKEYIVLAVSTESCDMETIRGRLKNDNVIRMLHAGLGMTTEIVELFEALETDDGVNKNEELGDLYWYIAIAFSALYDEFGYNVVTPGTGNQSWLGINLEETKAALLSAIAQYVDVIKRAMFYDKSCLDAKKIESLLRKIYKLSSWMIGVSGSGKLGDILDDNIVKLRKRYGEKFSEKGALHRDTANELSHITE